MSGLGQILEMHDRKEAYLNLSKMYFNGGAKDRKTIAEGWPYGVKWEYPSPFHLAWPDDSGFSPRERMRAVLLYYMLEGSPNDLRDLWLALAIVYNSANMAGYDPEELLLEVRDAMQGDLTEKIDEFLSREEKEKSMQAFMLKIGRDGMGRECLLFS